MIVASISTASAVPDADLLDEDDLRGRERADRDANSSAAAVTIRPVRSSPSATASRSRAAVAGLLDRDSRNTP